jgi:hypothetical protein
MYIVPLAYTYEHSSKRIMIKRKKTKTKRIMIVTQSLLIFCQSLNNMYNINLGVHKFIRLYVLNKHLLNEWLNCMKVHRNIEQSFDLP